jgi:hypothetical protein
MGSLSDTRWSSNARPATLMAIHGRSDHEESFSIADHEPEPHLASPLERHPMGGAGAGLARAVIALTLLKSDGMACINLGEKGTAVTAMTAPSPRPFAAIS